jgi:hypothetical protein
MYAAVVRSVHIQRNQTSADGKYLVYFHVQVATGRLHGMQLDAIGSSLQRVRLHDPQQDVGRLQFYSNDLAISFTLLRRDSAKPILSMNIWDRVLNLNS